MFIGLQVLFSWLVGGTLIYQGAKAFRKDKKRALAWLGLGALSLLWFPWVCWDEDRRTCTDSEGTYLISTKDWNAGERCKER
ncbi:type VI protein secretion system component VasK [Armatimonas rosea]|jgi:type VI protein secretion system component VasK|uniref:Type VI protein secretion system component VasK n=1 Tax=Armatimonas rosea TaxID=685828 RepID=A0A7W9W7C2_ARMRO|nr:type VI protein secretion system component VasK [Armatimonas rosea]